LENDPAEKGRFSFRRFVLHRRATSSSVLPDRHGVNGR
jgi:hypothetical protein